MHSLLKVHTTLRRLFVMSWRGIPRQQFDTELLAVPSPTALSAPYRTGGTSFGISLNDKQLTMELVDADNIPDAWLGAMQALFLNRFHGPHQRCVWEISTKAPIKKALEVASDVNEIHPCWWGRRHRSNRAPFPLPLPQGCLIKRFG